MMKYYNKKKKKDEGWVVKNTRPEDFLENPSLYYTEKEIEDYSHSGGMKRAQESIAFRMLELINLKKREKILDVGCGTGYTMNVLISEGYKVEGIDLMQGMVDEARKNGFNVKKGDMKNLSKTISKKYNTIISISAFQWIKEQDIKEVAKSFYKALEKDGNLIIQYYPKSKKHLLQTLKTFKENGFSGNEIIDNENDPRKRLVFLILKKE